MSNAKGTIMSRSSQSSKKKKRVTKIPRTYYDSLYHNLNPLPQAFADELAGEMWAYYTSPDRITEKNGLTIEEFLGSYRLQWTSYEDLIKRYDSFARTVNDIKNLISGRRRNGMMYRDLDYQSCARDMRHYSPIWRECQQHEEDLKRELTIDKKQEPTVINVIVPPLKKETPRPE